MSTWADASVRTLLRLGAWLSVVAVVAVPITLAIAAVRTAGAGGASATVGLEVFATTVAVAAITAAASTFLGMSSAALAAELLPDSAGRLLREFSNVIARTPGVLAGVAAALAFPFLREAPPPQKIAELSLILTLAISPVVANVVFHALRRVPFRLREAAIATGATRDFALTHAFLPFVRGALTGAATFAAARALGDGALVAVVGGSTTIAAALLLGSARTGAVPPVAAAWALALLAAVVAFNVAGRRLARYRHAR